MSVLMAVRRFDDDRRALLAFRGVSHSCLPKADCLLFRSITLHGSRRESYTQSLLDRLLDAETTIVGYVRHLRIGPFPLYSEKLFHHKIAPKLKQLLSELKELQSFRYD
jgi:hypothetical protein